MIRSFMRMAQLIGKGCAATSEPNQPGGLTATGGAGQISLSWSADATPSPNEAVYYEVERSNDGLGSWAVIVTNLGATTYVDSGLGSSVTRHYRVTAYNCFGGSLASATANATTTVAAPAAPSGLTATATSSTAISLSWQDNSSTEDGFKVERSTDNTNWTEIAGALAANTTSYSSTGLSPSTLYYHRVRAYNTGGNSAYTSSASATTQSGGLSPAWSIDWSSGTPSGYTLTRASSGTYVDSSGYIASASTDVARLTHNSSGSRLGLLVEGARTNYQRASENTTQAQGDTAGYTGTQNDATAPDNAVTADRVELTGSGYFYKRSNTVMAAGTYTGSFYVKQKSAGQTILVRINGTSSGGTTASFTTTADWQRVSVTFTSSTSQQCQIGIDQRTGLGGPGTACDVLVWGFQIEDGGEATSYIPNTGTTSDVTRSADLAHVLDSSITSWGDPGALVVHFYPPGQAGTLISTDDASTAQVGIEASTTTAARAFWSSGSTATGSIGSGVQKAVHYWNGSTSKFCINGGTVQSGTNNLTIGNTDFVTLGAEATDSSGVPGTFSQYANCVIRKVEFYSGTLTDANLQTITT